MGDSERYLRTGEVDVRAWLARYSIGRNGEAGAADSEATPETREPSGPSR